MSPRRNSRIVLSLFLALAGAESVSHAAVTTTNAKIVTQVSGVSFDHATTYFGTSKSGRYVAFACGATNIVPGITPTQFQIFWLDRKTGETKLVSKNGNGQPADGACSEPKISDDGTKVVFLTTATNLGFQSNGAEQVYYADLTANTLKLLSKDTLNHVATKRSWYPDISGDGTVVTFTNDSPNMMPLLPVHMHVFVYDAKTTTLEFASVNNQDHFANDMALVAHLSKDGRYVVFETDATNMPDDTPVLSRKIILRDRVTQTTYLISKSQNGASPNSGCFGSSISENGRYISFVSYATNLTADSDVGSTEDIFVVDRKTGKISRVPCDFDPALQEFANTTSISNNGRRVAILVYYKNPFQQNANMLRTRVYDRIAKKSTVIEPATPDVCASSDFVDKPALSGNGKKLFFVSGSLKLGTGGTQQMFVLAMPKL